MGYRFVKTGDGSVGLFDNGVNDIYHSSLGAYKEAIEKFVLPAQLERFKNKNCKVLDICYGIGYNTKALLKYSIENNLNIKFKIDAIEMNKELIELSPFIKFPDKSNFSNEIDKFILKSILNEIKIDLKNINEKIRKNKGYLSLYKPYFKEILEKFGYKYNLLDKIISNLHNIYYHNVAFRQKILKKTSILDNSALKWHADDARKVILSLADTYDIIFLDAFTAAKQPQLWTKEFIGHLKDKLNNSTGLIISYSTSSPYRNALLNSGLKIGKFYEKNIHTTLASFSDNLIKYKLDDFELGLLNTNAGIMYSDANLTSTCNDILNKRKHDVNNSNLESTSSYYKRHKRKYGKH